MHNLNYNDLQALCEENEIIIDKLIRQKTNLVDNLLNICELAKDLLDRAGLSINQDSKCLKRITDAENSVL
jgi:hypothetical protein